MDKINLIIDRYKCFRHEEIELNNITVLTGANAAGKSSVIQTILLAKLTTDQPTVNKSERDFTVSFSLQNDDYALDLDLVDELIYKQSESDDTTIAIDGCKLQFNGGDEHEDGKIIIHFEDRGPLTRLFEGGFSYLNAEREGPRSEYKKYGQKSDCGCHGQYTGDVVSANSMTGMDKTRSLEFKEDLKFQPVFDEWVNYIFPGLAVSTLNVAAESYKVIIRNNELRKSSSAPNVGFGISYSLPIIVNALLMRKGGMIIVENPEAHLHAKAQSNMGYFLGRMAAAGVRVIVETHSEHIVNGIRRAVVDNKTTLESEDVNIYFYTQKNEITNQRKIKIDNEGNLSDFPVDFFDQSRQDMLELFRLSSPENS